MTGHYVLIGKEPKLVYEPSLNGLDRMENDGWNPKTDPLIKWAEWMEKVDERIIQQTRVGSIWISTVFLGLDHNWMPHGPPVLFETMVWDHSTREDYISFIPNRPIHKELDNLGNRHRTFDEAHAWHLRCIGEAVKLYAKPPLITVERQHAELRAAAGAV